MKVEWRGQKGELSWATNSVWIPGRTVRIISYRPPTGKAVHSISYKKLTTSATQPMRNHHCPEFLLFLQWILFKTIPPNFRLLHKTTFLFFVCWLSLRFVP